MRSNLARPRSQETVEVELVPNEVTRLIRELAESALRQRGLLMRPIPFFEYFDWLRAREEELKQDYQQYLVVQNEASVRRILRSCAFADMFSRDVLQNFNPPLRAGGESAQRTLWGAAVVIDQLLDEEGVETIPLATVLKWAAGQARDGNHPDHSKYHGSNPHINALVSMLTDTLEDCRTRAVDAAAYARFDAHLSRILDAEMASVNLSLDTPPGERVRIIVRDKSVLLNWAGFLAYTLGQRLDPSEAKEYQTICEAIGEVLWIMDDLMDLEEDLERGIWNRTLWRLYDDAGKARFRKMTNSRLRLAEEIIHQGSITREVDEIGKRVELLETHPRINDPEKLRAMISFWLTAWLGIYA